MEKGIACPSETAGMPVDCSGIKASIPTMAGLCLPARSCLEIMHILHETDHRILKMIDMFDRNRFHAGQVALLEASNDFQMLHAYVPMIDRYSERDKFC
jgi:hypothetical protein